MWRNILAWLASLAADPAEINSEPPKAAAAVAVARASMQTAPEKEMVVQDPPLVQLPKKDPGRLECVDGECFWVDPETGKRYRVQNQ